MLARVLCGWLRGIESPLRDVVFEVGDVPQATRSERRLVLRNGVEIVGLEVDELIVIAKALS